MPRNVTLGVIFVGMCFFGVVGMFLAEEPLFSLFFLVMFIIATIWLIFETKMSKDHLMFKSKLASKDEMDAANSMDLGL